MQMALRDEGFSVEYFLATTSVASPSCEAFSSNLWCLGIEGGTSDEEKSLQAHVVVRDKDELCRSWVAFESQQFLPHNRGLVQKWSQYRQICEVKCRVTSCLGVGFSRGIWVCRQSSGVIGLLPDYLG